MRIISFCFQTEIKTSLSEFLQLKLSLFKDERLQEYLIVKQLLHLHQKYYIQDYAYEIKIYCLTSHELQTLLDNFRACAGAHETLLDLI